MIDKLNELVRTFYRKGVRKGESDSAYTGE